MLRSGDRECPLFLKMKKACLNKAFQKMRDRGLIALHETYCETCGPEEVLAASRGSHRDQEKSCGFAHVGEWTPTRPDEELRIPLLFGFLADKEVVYHDSGS